MVRILRISKAIYRIGTALGGEAAARLLPALGFTSSADTLLRLVHHAEVDPAPTPRVVGVDDWAIRRGHTYGTILVDLERRAPIDLLPDRTADTLARWLKEHPAIALVARDRAETYAQGIREGAPHAVQVADRWHLLKNLGDVLERLLQRHRGALERAATQASATTPASASASAPTTSVEGTKDPFSLARRAEGKGARGAARSRRELRDRGEAGEHAPLPEASTPAHCLALDGAAFTTGQLGAGATQEEVDEG